MRFDGKSVRLAVALASLLFGPVLAHADDWASLGQDATRTRVTAERSGSAFGAMWSHVFTSSDPAPYHAFFASPAVADGVLVIGTQRNILRALRESDGHILWERQLGGGFYASPTIWRGLVFALGVDQQLYALRLTDGVVVWQKALGAVGYASPTVVDGSLFVAVGYPAPRAMRIDAATGNLIWQTEQGRIHQAAYASLAVSQGRVIVGESGGHYHSFSVDDGHWQWTARTEGRVHLSSPLIVGDRVYLIPGGTEARVVALDLTSGAIVNGWPLTLPALVADEVGGVLLQRDHVVSSLAVAGDTLVLNVRFDDRIDTNGDGAADTFVARETLFGLDRVSRQVLWSTANGRRASDDGNQIPTHGFCGTPALYRGADGELLIAAASSVSARLRVLGARDGQERWSATLSAPTRSSPVLANGRLVIATDAGVVHSFLSTTNKPPVVGVLGFSPGGGRAVDLSSVVLQWGAAFDPEGDSLRYEVRVDTDGEVLHDWALAVVTSAGQQSLRLKDLLVAGGMYTFAVRARDGAGAYSAWSRSETFRAVAAPAVSLEGRVTGGLLDAIEQAAPGQTITLGAGTYALGNTLRLPAGVSLAGAGPHLTILSAQGLATGVAPGAGSTLRQLTVTGALIGVDVEAAADVALTNVILRDNVEAGLVVRGTGSAKLVNGTLVRNGEAVRAIGKTEIRNALVTLNDVGIAAQDPSVIDHRYNDIYGNRSHDLVNTVEHSTDIATRVAFTTDDGGDLLLLKRAQPSTDRGDPSDSYDNEPSPNGARINIGAFGNTSFAELSGLIPPATGAPPPPPSADEPRAGGKTGGGACSLAFSGEDPPSAGLVLVAAAFLFMLRRQRRS